MLVAALWLLGLGKPHQAVWTGSEADADHGFSGLLRSEASAGVKAGDSDAGQLRYQAVGDFHVAGAPMDVQPWPLILSIHAFA
ncbi:hypothetical protein PtA15_7A621 [Puccinia triticina]|uniref:Uncharacterized protein n=1 Tax=Puccinia triticina TaxID=208348 RepID=A0ABY7CVZ5_9BASI|nr:uncharacterized protein PtA15_7A621 [Puccinia triticina]WAQ86892.1 hypothetical protein PtA15_7A621 [Puccinia triticina]WAR56759.1 hypothetical protein PtB15_7B609 [Puccinia triticina]